ncbi:MAG TPA: polysaccharide biosynthesis/export family protein [Candidatus Acidoferrum sp.]|nr:polysaccharide biosynthesis/export family protein [Candidatus Acidoferrum sp.]
MQPGKLGALVWVFVPTGLLVLLALAPCSRAQQAVLETPQQVNDRLRSMSASARVMQNDYIIGNGDLLVLEVFDVKELSREVRVSQTGSIGIPLVPVRLHVGGLTEAQTEQKIAEVLEANGLVTHPQVSVSVKERKSKPITVVGAVLHPMVYQVDRPVSILEVLAEAGGIANDAGDTVIVTRPSQEPSADSSEPPAIDPPDPTPATTAKDSTRTGAAPVESASNSASNISSTPKTTLPGPASTGSPDAIANPPALNEPPPLRNTITINLNELMESGDAVNNIILRAGDIVTVPHAGIAYILGAVNKPGGYVMANDRSQMSALKILALSGGLSRTAKKDRAVIIRKDSQGQQHEVAVDLKKVMERTSEDVLLQPSDILYVPDSASKQAMYRALEFGLALGAGVALYRVAYH